MEKIETKLIENSNREGVKDTVNKGDPFAFDVFKAMRLFGVIFTYADVLDWCPACESIFSLICSIGKCYLGSISSIDKSKKYFGCLPKLLVYKSELNKITNVIPQKDSDKFTHAVL